MILAACLLLTLIASSLYNVYYTIVPAIQAFSGHDRVYRTTQGHNTRVTPKTKPRPTLAVRRWILTRHSPIESHFRTIPSTLAPGEVQRHMHVSSEVHEEFECIRCVGEPAFTVQELCNDARLIPQRRKHIRVAASVPPMRAGEGARRPR